MFFVSQFDLPKQLFQKQLLGETESEKQKRYSSDQKKYVYTQFLEEKKAFREQWARLGVQKLKMKVSIVHTRTESKIDISKGRYKSFFTLVRKEGLEAATKFCRKMAQMGAPWTQWDAQWDHLTFLVFEKGMDHIFTEAWALHEKRQCELGEDGTIKPIEVGAPSPVPAPVVQPIAEKSTEEAPVAQPEKPEIQKGKKRTAAAIEDTAAGAKTTTAEKTKTKKHPETYRRRHSGTTVCTK